MKGTHYGLLKPSSSHLYSLLSGCGFFAHAQQDQTGSISGKVTFKNKGVASILVIAIDTNDSRDDPISSVAEK